MTDPRTERAANPEPEDLDGCELDFAAEANDDDEAEFLPMFPQGEDTPNLDAKADAYRALGATDA